MLILLIAMYDFIQWMNLTGAFLYEYLEKEICINQFKEFKIYAKEKKIRRFVKSLYELKQTRK